MTVTKILLLFVILLGIWGVRGYYFSDSLANPSVNNQCRSQNAAWYGCSADTDCVITTDTCGVLDDAVNKNFRQKAALCNDRVAAAINCQPPAITGEYRAVCVSNECKTVIK